MISATGKCLVIVATTALLVVGVFGAMQVLDSIRGHQG